MTEPELRIVSLLPSATEIVCALGLESSLVGVTHECDYPAEVRRKPVLTASVLSGSSTSGEIDRHIRRLVHDGSSIYSLDAERLEELHPGLVLTQELCEVCAVSYPIVERAVRRMDGDTQLVSLEPETLADVFETIQAVGRLTRREDAAGDVVAALETRLKAVRERLAGARPRPTVCLEWIDPPYHAGHWTPQLVELAGGRDLLGTPGQPAKPIPVAAVAAANPEVLVVMACGFSLERSVEAVRAIQGRFAPRNAELWVVDGNSFFSRPGPRLVDSVEIMAGILHSDRFEAPAVEAAVRLA